jgi:flagellar biosynthetic protein FliP
MVKLVARVLLLLGLAATTVALAASAPAPTPPKAPNVEITVSGLMGASTKPGSAQPVSDVIKIVVGLTALSLLPAIVVSMTAFIRIAIVLSMLRHAIGMPETPPNVVLVSLALFMTLFVMQPTINTAYREAWQPFAANRIGVDEAVSRASEPIKAFMSRNTRPADVALIYEIANRPVPATATEVGIFELIPAFVINELRVAFQIGFVIFLPFLVIDLVISSVLLALGMMMVPPTTIALPIKILMFVLIDGWSLVLRGVVGSFK